MTTRWLYWILTGFLQRCEKPILKTTGFQLFSGFDRPQRLGQSMKKSSLFDYVLRFFASAPMAPLPEWSLGMWRTGRVFHDSSWSQVDSQDGNAYAYGGVNWGLNPVDDETCVEDEGPPFPDIRLLREQGNSRQAGSAVSSSCPQTTGQELSQAQSPILSRPMSVSASSIRWEPC